VELPLEEHPFLDLSSDFSRIAVMPVAPGVTPYLEVGGPPRPGRAVKVRGENGRTNVSLDGSFGPDRDDEKWWEGSFWEQAFWEKRFFGRGSRVTLYVPTDLRAHIRAAAAKVDVRDLHGADLQIEADAGALTLVNVSGRLRLSTQAGRIEGREIAGSIDISSNAASVRLDVTSLLPGTHRITANMGAVHISLARGMPLRVDARTQMGSARVDYPQTKDASIVLDVEADLGAIRIHGSDRNYTSPQDDAPPMPPPQGPYRDAAPGADEDLEKILARVADGTLSKEAAKDLLKALGWP
jgi:hypothetical protein